MSSVERLDELIARLERAGEQLRSGELSPEVSAPAPGQDSLL
jgi:hypothetical protein